MGAVAQVRVKLIRVFAGLLLASVVMIAVALWLGTLGRNSAHIEVDALVVGEGPALQYVLPTGQSVEARFAEPVDQRDYPVGQGAKVKVDPQVPDIAYEMPSGWLLFLAWLIGIPGVLLLISTLLVGRMVLKLARRVMGPRDDEWR